MAWVCFTDVRSHILVPRKVALAVQILGVNHTFLRYGENVGDHSMFPGLYDPLQVQIINKRWRLVTGEYFGDFWTVQFWTIEKHETIGETVIGSTCSITPNWNGYFDLSAISKSGNLAGNSKTYLYLTAISKSYLIPTPNWIWISNLFFVYMTISQCPYQMCKKQQNSWKIR
jgi:hypothetical protein